LRLELIFPWAGGVSQTDTSSALVSVTSIICLQTERLQVLLYQVSPSILLSFVALCGKAYLGDCDYFVRQMRPLCGFMSTAISCVCGCL